MKVDFWFDFNIESFEMLNRFNEVYKNFNHHELISVFYRSNPDNLNQTRLHEIYHFGRKKSLPNTFFYDLLKQSTEFLDDSVMILELAKKHLFDPQDLIDALNNKTYQKIVLNQKEHATLNKIQENPTLTFSHGFRVAGLKSIESIKDAMIQMYEAELGIEYCEGENCER